MVQNVNEQAHRRLQMVIDHQLSTTQKRVADIVRTSNPNQV